MTTETIALQVGYHQYRVPMAMWVEHFAASIDDPSQLHGRDGWVFGIILRALSLSTEQEQLNLLSSLSDYDLQSLAKDTEEYGLKPLHALVSCTLVPPLATGTEDHAVTFCTSLLTATVKQPFIKRLVQLPETEAALRSWFRSDRAVRGFLCDILEGKTEYNQASNGYRVMGQWTHQAFPTMMQYLVSRLSSGGSSASSTSSSSSPAPSPSAAAMDAAQSSTPNPSPPVPSPDAASAASTTSAPAPAPAPAPPQTQLPEAVSAAFQSGARMLQRLGEVSSSWLSQNAAAAQATQPFLPSWR